MNLCVFVSLWRSFLARRPFRTAASTHDHLQALGAVALDGVFLAPRPAGRTAPFLRASLISESPAAPNGRAQIVIDEGAVMDIAGAIPGGPGILEHAIADVDPHERPRRGKHFEHRRPHRPSTGCRRPRANTAAPAERSERTRSAGAPDPIEERPHEPGRMVSTRSSSGRPSRQRALPYARLVIATRSGMSAPKKFSSPSTPRNRAGNQESRPPKPTSLVSSSPIRAEVI